VGRPREWLAGLILGSFGLVLSLLLLEGGVRLMHLVPDRFWEPDPLLGARLIPGASGYWSQEDREFVVSVLVNEHGRRDVERAWEKAAGVRRILVLGDSFVEALQVPLEETFFRKLERALDEAVPGQRHEVLAAGVSGYGTAGATLYFERDGHRYDPDLVVLAFYPGNDIRNNSPTLEDRFVPVYDAEGRLLRVDVPVREGGEDRPSRLPQWQTKRYLRRLVLTQQPQIAAWLVSLGLLQPAALRSEATEAEGIPVAYGVFANPASSEWEDAWKYSESLLDRLNEAAEKSGARFSVAIGTIREQIYPELWREVLSQHPPMAERTWDLDAPQRRVEDWCVQRQVPCLTLAPSFRGAATAGEPMLHFRHDGHWTAAGHSLVADELTAFILRHLDGDPLGQ